MDNHKKDLKKYCFKLKLIFYLKILLFTCKKCLINNKDTIDFHCRKQTHSICFNCTFIYFMSSNFEGLTTKSIATKCPKCQKGILEINLDDYIKILELLLVLKNPNFGQEESNTKSFGEIGENKGSKVPQKKGLTDLNKKVVKKVKIIYHLRK